VSGVTEELAAVVHHARTLLLDFDGPLCNIFSGYPAPAVADDLRRVIIEHHERLLPAMVDESDPLQLLRLTKQLGNPVLVRDVAQALRGAELKAVETATPTPGADDVITAAMETGRRLAVVSNNSVEAVNAYLELHGLRSSFSRLIGRYDGIDPELMKPNSHLVMLAIIGTDAAPWSTVLVGDSVSDITAARDVPIACIGYANKSGKAENLITSGANAIITDMTALADALRLR
jgi:phosphoglycolate phosphatase-like HAD superfamily hydrolase